MSEALCIALVNAVVTIVTTAIGAIVVWIKVREGVRLGEKTKNLAETTKGELGAAVEKANSVALKAVKVASVAADKAHVVAEKIDHVPALLDDQTAAIVARIDTLEGHVKTAGGEEPKP